MSDDSTFSRRKALRSISSSIFTVGVAGTAAARDADLTTIVTAKSRGRPVASRAVSKRWYDHVERSRAVQDRLADRYLGEDWCHAVDRVRSDHAIGERRTTEVVLRVTDRDAAPDLPARRRGVPLRVEQSTPPEQHAEFCNSETYDCVQGGAYVQTESGVLTGSLCCLVEFWNEPYFLTVAHNFTGCGYDSAGKSVMHGEDPRRKLGEVFYADWEMDVALVEPTSDMEVTGYGDESLAYDGYERDSFTTRDGVDDVVSWGYEIEGYGARTCGDTGEATGERKFDTCNGQVATIDTTLYNESGDSGGPVFIKDEYGGHLSMLGMHKAGDDPSVEVAAYAINDKYGIEFTTPPTC